MGRFFVLLLIVAVSSPGKANDVPVYKNDLESWEKTMLQYVSDWRNMTGKDRSQVEAMKRQIQSIMSQNPSRPRLLIILGKLHGHEAGKIIAGLKEKGIGMEKRGQNPDYLKAISKLNEYFKKAISLDTSDLTLNELNVVNTTVTKSEIKVKNLRNMLSRWEEGDRFVMSEGAEADPVTQFRFDAYSRMVTAYLDEHRYDKALSVLDEMQPMFPDRQEEIERGRASILERKQSYQQQVVQEEKDVDTQKGTDKSGAVEQSDDSGESRPEDRSGSKTIDEEANYQSYIVWGILVLVVLLVLYMGVRWQRRKERSELMDLLWLGLLFPMGTQTTTMQQAGTGEGAGDLSFHVDPITLHPPNLKIWAERGYDIQAGLERGEFSGDQIIGFEGASLTSDNYVKIHTEWLAQMSP